MSDQTPRVPDQPDGIEDDSYDLPDKARAAGRVNEFLAWYGDGRLHPCVLPGTEDEMPPLFARDLQALTNAVLAPPVLAAHGSVVEHQPALDSGPCEVEPKHGGRCTMIGDRCVSMHCLRCGEPTGPQGHLGCTTEAGR
ncbi:hypothetical protein [Amycolatopsis sp. NPDC051372]|uniref:hypothetical protein n=1 Tax=Amycolatopsis sp. NPDC051372 TaxID=3155669 RepID=UPI00342DEA53